MVAIRKNRLNQKRLVVGDVFPDFKSLSVYKGKQFRLSETAGKYRLIDFWGTWCIPCVGEMPSLNEFYKKHSDNLIVIGIANDSYQRWKAFLDKKAYHWIQIIDQDPNKLSDRINVEVYPTKYLLDPDGKIILIIKDADENVWNKMERLLIDKSK